MSISLQRSSFRESFFYADCDLLADLLAELGFVFDFGVDFFGVLMLVDQQ